MSNLKTINVTLKDGTNRTFYNSKAMKVFDKREDIIVEEWCNGKIKEVHTITNVEKIDELESLNEVI